MSLRERNRQAAMRETQREALRLFRERGFAQVTVEEIARSLGMAASTIFRHFGTKEAIIVWDEHDAVVDKAIAERFSQREPEQSPLHALRDVFAETLAVRYHHDLDFELDRIGFIYQTEALHAAAIEAQFADRDELTTALERLLSKQHKSAAPLLAGAALLALDVAIEHWQEHGGRGKLDVLIHEAFATLEKLGTIR